jgi:hypothetical protein
VIDLDRVHDLLLAIDEPALTAAVRANDDGLDAYRLAGAACRPPGERRREAEAAYVEAMTAHLFDPARPAPDYAEVIQADTIEATTRLDLQAHEQVIAQRAAEVETAIVAHRLAVLRFVARRSLDGESSPAVHELYVAAVAGLTIASQPATVTSRGQFDLWSPPALDPDPTGLQMYAELREHYRTWFLEQLTHPKRSTMGDGVLHLSADWPAPLLLGQFDRQRQGQHPAVIVANVGTGVSGGIIPGDVVRVGTGPNGEPGIEDVQWREERERRAAAFALTAPDGQAGVIDTGPHGPQARFSIDIR